MELYRKITDDEIPLLFINDTDGIGLFYNLLRNSQRLPGIIDVMAPPFVVKIEYINSVEYIDLCLFYPDENGILGYNDGMFINHNDSHTGYKFQADNVEAFLQKYKTEL